MAVTAQPPGWRVQASHEGGARAFFHGDGSVSGWAPISLAKLSMIGIAPPVGRQWAPVPPSSVVFLDKLAALDGSIHVRQPEPSLGEVAHEVRTPRPGIVGPDEVLDLCKMPESIGLEFKGSLRVALETNESGKAGEVSKAVFFSTLKTVAAFMNSSGGMLLVGVQDNGSISGVEVDYPSFEGENKRDEWVRCVAGGISTYLGDGYWDFVEIRVIQVLGRDVGMIQVAPATTPVFVRRFDKGSQERDYYIRTPAGSKAASAPDAVLHAMRRWTSGRTNPAAG